jgi:hypothetical protein
MRMVYFSLRQQGSELLEDRFDDEWLEYGHIVRVYPSKLMGRLRSMICGN